MATPIFNNNNKINQETTQSCYPQVWQQVSPFTPMMFSGQINKDSTPACMVSILHQNSTSLLQNFQNQNFVGPAMYSNIPMNSCMVSQTAYKNAMIERGFESSTKMTKGASSGPSHAYSPILKQRYQNVESYQNLERSSYGQESLRKAMVLNQWMQSNASYLKSTGMNYQ